ncbi:hypothetical protein BN1708_005633 [Verticillium longisporum]|uniref:Transcription factor Pcc1 n=1 Tax=Verticillium longisporum TaxID=100787 RepID=A0A0G4MCX6_VERLO|nr:hypothetical protein BN1708_005633 [Verticillium longisporum]
MQATQTVGPFFPIHLTLTQSKTTTSLHSLTTSSTAGSSPPRQPQDFDHFGDSPASLPLPLPATPQHRFPPQHQPDPRADPRTNRHAAQHGNRYRSRLSLLSLTLTIPFPTDRLAAVAHQALAVDKELSPLVSRAFAVKSQPANDAASSVLEVHYKATTNRMLRVAVNSFMDSLKLVVEVIEQLDADVLEQK